MKTKNLILFGIILLSACNYSERGEKYKELSIQDSTLLQDAKKKDSSITSYMTAMNLIQDNLDSIKHREKLLTIYSSEGGSGTGKIIADIKMMDALILKNGREIALLQSKIKKMDKKDYALQKAVEHLNRELIERDSTISSLQSMLAKGDANMKEITQEFDDSLIAFRFERAEENSLRSEVNTVYYTVGTVKELKEKGVIDKEGGIVGIGSSIRLKQNFNSTCFTTANKTTLALIPLNARFSKIVTYHPNNAFKVTQSNKSDSLCITDPQNFWSESKYLVVVVK